ncbi:MAG: ABC transporter permease [Bacillota bacterium]|nr:ABC transporter permease [Bacillota bacterium]
MKAFFKYLSIQFKMDLRDKGTLLNFYLVPILFFFVVGPVFSSANPYIKPTLAASMSILAITMGAIMGMPIPLVKMRESGTLRAFRVSGIPSWAVIFVQGLSSFIHLFIVSIIIYVCSPIAFHSDLPKDPALFFAVIAVLLIASIAIGLLIGVTAKSQSFASMLSMIIFFPSIIVSGIMFPVSMLPNALLWIGRIFPATYAAEALYGLAYKINTNINAWLALGIIAVIGVLVFAIAISLFDKKIESELL